MSNRSRRDLVRFDYQKYHRTGVKVPVESCLQNLPNMAGNPALDKKILAKIEQFKRENDPDLLYDVTEIEDAVSEFRRMIDSYIDVHVALREQLENYTEVYPDYDMNLDGMTEWVKKCRIIIKDMKKEAEAKASSAEFEARKNFEEERIIQLKLDLTADEKVFREKIRRNILTYYEEDSFFVEDIEKNVFSIQEQLERYSQVVVQIERLGQPYVSTFDGKIDGLFDCADRFLKDMKKRIVQEKTHEHNENLQKKIFEQDEIATRDRRKKVQVCQSLFDHTSERISILQKKCEIDFSNLSDVAVLELKKDSKRYDEEYSDILDRLVKLGEAYPSEFQETSHMLDELGKHRDTLKSALETFKINLDQEIVDRDLSEEKIKNASLLGIKIPKFSGYQSQMDFYTFKSEFEKLIVPRVQKSLLPDYLKNNYLEGQALQVVKEMTQIDEIWDRLKLSFGNVTTMLNGKLRDLGSGEPLWKFKKEKLVKSLTKFKNCMTDLTTLAEKHNVENQLYHSSNLATIYNMIGRDRQAKIMRKSMANKLDDKGTWSFIIGFLEEEIKLKEQMILFDQAHQSKSNKDKIGNSDDSDSTTKNNNQTYSNAAPSTKCVICGKTDHVPTVRNGVTFINYFACEKFANMTVKERFIALKSKRMCFQCLVPGATAKHSGTCYGKYVCPHDSHKGFDTGIHVLICDRHKDDDANKKLFEEYKSKLITYSNSNHRDFSKNISISYFNADQNSYTAHDKDADDADDVAIFALQTIAVKDDDNRDHFVNLFFDGGCGDGCFRRRAINMLVSLGRAVNTASEPLEIEGVAGQRSLCEYGKYKISLPGHDGTNVEIEGICMEMVTAEFPRYPLETVKDDIFTTFASTGGDVSTLPGIPKVVGGETDVMIGCKYLKYHPKEVFALPNGLTLYKSFFANPDGSRGVICGPHRAFTEFHQQLGTHVNLSAYLSEAVKAYRYRFRLRREFSMMSDLVNNGMLDVYLNARGQVLPTDSSESEPISPPQSEPPCENLVNPSLSLVPNSYYGKRPQQIARFDAAESAGTDISHRCVSCRGCERCKKGSTIELVSVQEEIEQELIDRCVKVFLEEGYSIARLPFLCDPSSKLTSNRDIALKMYRIQLRKLNARPKDKLSLIAAERKLHDAGYVAFYDDLNVDQQHKIKNNKVQLYLPWLPAFNENSVSSPCRPVFNGSHPTSTGFSLNDILAKGRNNMNNLVMLFIRWMFCRFGFHTDVQKMYNTILLDENDWAYQLYLWDDELDPSKDPLTKVILTNIYGIVSSGNIAERALRQTASLQKDTFPRVHEIIMNMTYVDDCMGGEHSIEERNRVTGEMVECLGKGGFKLKGFTFSGCDPPDDLKHPDNTINVAGMRWFSRPDLLSLNLGEMKFGRTPKRGKPPKSKPLLPPGKFTRRDCAGRVAEIFDLVGKCTPLTAGFKIDLRELSKRKLDWDDCVPDDLVPQWENNFEIINQLGEIKFRRVLIPDDAIDLKMETLEMSDASLKMACSAIYGRFRRKNGSYSCQLIFARSKIIPEGTNIPRAELIAAVLNATTGHIVAVSMEHLISERIHLVDSQIVLFWINNRKSELKQWLRNRVIEITRLTDRKNWYYIESKFNNADLGTRKGVKIADILPDSEWICGAEWMKQEKSKFPIKSVEQLKLTSEELEEYHAEFSAEVLDEDWIHQQLAKSYSAFSILSDKSAEEIKKRYVFSNYVLDPNKFRFRKVVRILGLVFLFISKFKCIRGKKIGQHLMSDLSSTKLPDQFQFVQDKFLVTKGAYSPPLVCAKGLVVELTEVFLKFSLLYYFTKSTLEIKNFIKKNVYTKISTEREGILYYNGRILPSQQIGNELKLADVCLDLSMSTFCVPLIDKYSPLAFSVINEVHWYSDDARHSGNETVWRYVQLIAHVIEGKPIVKQFRLECPRCRFLRKKAIEVAMGPVSDDHLKVAPPFYVCQVDLFGHFWSHSDTNSRAKTKIWFVIFCCCVTGGVQIKTMTDYSTDSFYDAFIRFSCRVGYPYKLLPDAGSQLVKGCGSMVLSFTDLANRLHEKGVKFEVCPIGAHYMHGKVERRIRSVRESFGKVLHKEKLSSIQWETLAEQVANTMNNLPIAVRNETQGFENADLLTPNRLMLGRNNNRCPVGTLRVTGDVSKILERNDAIFTTWFQAWLVSYVPDLMLQPKWFNSDKDPKVGDIILFLKSDKEFEKLYQYGMISDLKRSRDGKIRQIDIQYVNASEKTKRFTTRGAREVVVIHHIDELGLLRELNCLASQI